MKIRFASSKLALLALMAPFTFACGAPAESEGKAEADYTGQETALVIPLLDSDGKTLLSKRNADFKAAGFKEVPDTMELTAKTVDARRNEFMQIVENYEKLKKPGEALVYAMSLAEYQPKSGPSLCYKGDPTKVADLAASIGEGMLSDQYSQWAWRYKTTKWTENEDGEDYLPTEWATFDTKRADVLIVSSANDSGDSNDMTYIPPCAPVVEETVVVIPIMQDDGTLLSANNAGYKAVGEAEFPDTVEVTDTNIDAKRDEISALADRAEASKSTSGGEMMMYAYSPGAYLRKSAPSICFRGDAMKVAWILSSLSDNALSDQYSEWGWRYRAHKDLIDDEFESDMPEAWLKYDTKSDVVLIVSSADDDGTHDVVSLIPRCPATPKN